MEEKINNEEAKKKKLAMIISKGTLDMAYPPLILATTASSMGWEVGIFFTFYGLDILNKKKNKKLKVAPIGNPAMPISVPNIIGILPGMTAMATKFMKGMMKKSRMLTILELLQLAKNNGVKLFACTTTIDVMSIDEKNIIDGASFVGAASFLEFASDANITLFI